MKKWLLLLIFFPAVSFAVGELPTEGCEGTAVVAPGVPCATHNLVVKELDARIWRITQELTKNVSARVTAMSAADKARIDSYYAALLAYAATAGNSMLDFHWLIDMELTDILGIQMPVENEAINAALRYLMGADLNLRISQSARINDGLLEQDYQDFVDAVLKSKAVLDEAFLSEFNPLDMPQSNPRQEVVNPTQLN